MQPKNYTPIGDLVKKYHQANTLKPISFAKEAEPITRKVESSHIQEVVEHKEIEDIVKPYIEVRPETPKVPQELQDVGLKPVDTSMFKDYKNIKLPLTDDKIASGLQAPITSAFRWLAAFALYLLQQSHLTLKTIHGKVVRIVKS